MRPPRPPQPPGSRLSPTRAERAHWQAAADRLGMTLNEFVRGAMNVEAESVLREDSDEDAGGIEIVIENDLSTL